MTQGVQEQVTIRPAVKPEGHLFEVSGKVLRANVMPSSCYPALEKRERAFNGVGVNISDYIDLVAVVDGLVLIPVNASVNHGFGIASPIIGNHSIHRRPAIKEIIAKEKAHYDKLVKIRDESGLDYHVFSPQGPRTVYLYGDDLFVSYSDTIDWVPKLSKLSKFGREVHHLVNGKPEIEGEPYVQWGAMVIDPIPGWPTEEEIAACIAESAEREKAGGGFSVNDFTAMQRALG